MKITSWIQLVDKPIEIQKKIKLKTLIEHDINAITLRR